MSWSGDPDSGRYTHFDCTCIITCDCFRMYCRGCNRITVDSCYQHGMNEEQRKAHREQYDRLEKAVENFGS